ncbi:hypothetical protein [Paenibacillus sp. JZ16]|uniref:hypothetical protein n=1 Tax=Paenibacillus sp. JZ16 TaxID=1906272 RepID=UPI00188D8F09|nr:hypothetical protein [Paenibacillus sp. JZ16]
MAVEKVSTMTKTDLNGQAQWEKTYRDWTNSEYVKRLVRTKDGYAMLGEHFSRNSLDYKRQYDVLSVDRNGELISRELFKGPPIYSVGSAAVTPDGGFIFPGTIKRGDVTKIQLMKLSPSVNIPPVERTLTDPDEFEGYIQLDSYEYSLAEGTMLDLKVILRNYIDQNEIDITRQTTFISDDPDIAEVDELLYY